MKYSKLFFVTILITIIGLPFGTFAQDNLGEDLLDFQTGEYNMPEGMLNPEDIPAEEFLLVKVIEITDEGTEELGQDYIEEYQELKAEVMFGEQSGEIIFLRHSGVKSLDRFYNYVEVGEQVVVVKIYDAFGGYNYYINDKYRITPIIVILAVFFALAIYFGRMKGFTSILGLFVSIAILTFFIVPRIIAGNDPILITLIGSLAIAVVSLYLAHGFNKRTTLAVASTLITLGIATVLAFIFVTASKLLGLGSEEAFYVQIGNLSFVDLKGLLLAGIIIGTLGVLDDITTAQTAVVGELKRANPDLPRHELYKRGVVVGKEHIASLVNTLVLAYAGASLPLFLLFNSNNTLPVWVLLNSEFVAEELIRTIVGSSALILAVPIATWLAAKYLSEHDVKDTEFHGHVH